MTPCNLRENIAKSKGVEQNLTRLEKNLTFDCFSQNVFSGKYTHNWHSFFSYRVGYVIGFFCIQVDDGIKCRCSKYVAIVKSLCQGSFLIKLVEYLPKKLTEQRYILQNFFFQKRVNFLEITHICLMRSTQGDNSMCSRKKALKYILF